MQMIKLLCKLIESIYYKIAATMVFMRFKQLNHKAGEIEKKIIKLSEKIDNYRDWARKTLEETYE